MLDHSIIEVGAKALVMANRRVGELGMHVSKSTLVGYGERVIEELGAGIAAMNHVRLGLRGATGVDDAIRAADDLLDGLRSAKSTLRSGIDDGTITYESFRGAKSSSYYGWSFLNSDLPRIEAQMATVVSDAASSPGVLASAPFPTAAIARGLLS